MEYVLPKLKYEYNALEPHIDEQTMRLHHTKHHQAYVDGLNRALKRLEEARASGDFAAIKALSRDLAFHGSGHVMHSIFWEVMCPAKESKEPKSGAFLEQVTSDFGSLDVMKKQFTEAANAVEGSGWALLVWEQIGKRLLVQQVENHQKLTIPGAAPLLVLDVWEHSYYILYRSQRTEYTKNWWNVVDWKEVERRFVAAKM